MAKETTTDQLVCDGKFRITGVPKGNFVVFGNEYNTEKLQEHQAQELLAAGWPAIQAVAPAAKAKGEEKA